ncbi:MAG: hypothetical protein KBG75_11070 [Pseudomonadales bacterium]|nr:hypothetical protein [Pseudomonadales bacterium]
MHLPAPSESYFSDHGKWYFHTHDSVMGPFHDKAEAQMAVLYFRQRMKWPSARQLHEFMDVGTSVHHDTHP